MPLKRIVSLWHKAENNLAYLVLILIALVPTIEVIARGVFKTGIPNTARYIQHLILWITFAGGMITSREGKHLSLSAGVELLKLPVRKLINTATAFISVTVTTVLTLSSLSLLLIGFDPDLRVGIFSIRFALLIVPLGFTVMTVRFITAAPGSNFNKIAAGSGVILGIFLAVNSLANILDTLFLFYPPFMESMIELAYLAAGTLIWPAVIILIISAFLGTPIFIVLAGITLFLFLSSWGVLEVIPNEAYTMLTGPAIPAIPLFTLVGFILSESKAGERLVRLFKVFFGWMPGGLAIMAILVSTFFTTFTGASGVTILALGALLSYMLVESGRYRENFSTGLLTASGSIGLLFPPSLPIILYGVAAQINIKNVFVGGILPGLLTVAALSAAGVLTALKSKTKPMPYTAFRVEEAVKAIRESIWDILLPVIILFSFFGGITTLVETGAIAVVYTLIVQVFIHQDIKLKGLPAVFLKTVPIIGGVLVILAVAKGLSYYIIDVEIPARLSLWVEANIHSKYLFLILLNIVLLITGCLMDVFSAIVVIVPLIIPLAGIYDIHPVHLGIIFLANLGLGYLTPPVGLNLFLASYRFEKPLSEIYRNVFPFFLILLATVLLITYVPWLSTGLLNIISF
ncbi:MAG: TRAP transporter large permease subunit [Spirochaeta sp.]|nr:TRAP transporter large permease subunit [Spirochaeta sp.]